MSPETVARERQDFSDQNATDGIGLDLAIEGAVEGAPIRMRGHRSQEVPKHFMNPKRQIATRLCPPFFLPLCPPLRGFVGERDESRSEVDVQPT